MARLIRLREVSDDTGLSKWTIARLEAAGEFPQRIRIGRYAVAFDADELDEWKQRRKDARDARRDARPPREPRTSV
ncbi:MAG TPA: AlpA family phage regulatory protein [Lysobacter sp.]